MVDPMATSGSGVDALVFAPTATLGFLAILFYCGLCWKKKQKPELRVIVNAVLQSSGIVVGALLVLSTFIDSVKATLTDIKLYVFISGLAVFVVSLQGLAQEILQIGAPRPSAARESASAISDPARRNDVP